MSIGVAFRELLFVVGLAVVGLAVAALVVFTPWYPDRGQPNGTVVTIVGPAGITDAP